MSFVVHVQPQDGSVGQTEAAACCVRTSVTWAVWQGCFAHGCSALSVSLDREAGLVKQDYLFCPSFNPTLYHPRIIVKCPVCRVICLCLAFCSSGNEQLGTLIWLWCCSRSCWRIWISNTAALSKRSHSYCSTTLDAISRTFRFVENKSTGWHLFLNGNAHC